MNVKKIRKNARRTSYKKGGARKPVKKQAGGVQALLQSRGPQLVQNSMQSQGLQTPGASIADQLGTQQGLGEKLRLGAEGVGMKLAGAGQGALGSLKEGLKGGKIGLGGAAALLGAGANKLISKNSATANDAYRTDKKQQTGAAVGGAIKGAGKGFDIGNKIIPGLGGAIGAGLGAIGGAFKSKRSLEKDRKASVRELRQSQNDQMKASAGPDPFSSKAGAGFNTATSATKAYDQVSRAQTGGVRMETGGIKSALRGYKQHRARMKSGKSNKNNPRGGSKKVAHTRGNRRPATGSATFEHGGVKQLKGGNMTNLPGGAVQFNGAKHAQGGIMLDENTEVEGGETMDKINMKKHGGKAKDYIFSEYLKLGGKSFATRHKEILNSGGSQKKLQSLARLQEKKAGRSPKIMQTGGDRAGEDSTAKKGDVNNLMEGLTGYGTTDSGLTGVEELNRAATAASNTQTQEEYEAKVADAERIREENEAKRGAAAEKGAVEEIDPETGQVIYARNEAVNTSENIGSWLGDRESEMKNLPEEYRNSALFDKYKDDKGNFDTTKFESDEARKEFVDYYNNLPDHLVSGKFSEEGTPGLYEFGDQWNTRRILQEEPGPDAVGEFQNIEFDAEIPDEVPGDAPEPPEGGTTVTKRNRDVPLGAWLAGGAQLIPPAYALLTKPKNVPGYAPQAYAKPQLPRVNYNAERSSNASDMRAAMASIENNSAGPAGMVNMIAAMGKKREGDLKIGIAESRANKQLSVEEAQLGAQTSQFNIGQDAQAQTFNRKLQREQIKDRREEVLGALDAGADRIAGITGDVLDYRGQERLAEAISGETGVLLRERLKGQINPTTGNPYTDIEIAELAGKMKEEGNPPGAYGKVKGKKGGKEKEKKNKTGKNTTYNAEGYEIDRETGELTGKGRRQQKRAQKSNPPNPPPTTAKEENEKDIKEFEQNKKAVDKANKQNERRLAKDPNQEVTFNSNAQNPMTEEKWDKMSNTEKIEYTKNETPEQAAIRRESGIGVVDTSRPDGTKVEGASLRREDVKRNYPNAQLGSFTNAKGQIIYYPKFADGPSPDYRKGGYLKRRGVVKRKRK
tara:strand:- start:20002 stop:23241 length:3240 start_codon:yes stop_codon:yes gene_type:complete